MSEEEEAKKNKANQRRLLVMFFMTFGFFLVEIGVGYYTNCVSLVADSFHMLSDLAALLVAFFSVKMAPKPWAKNTFGWARAEVLGAMVNSVLLVALCFSILLESIQRFLVLEGIAQPQLILVVGAIGLLINIIGILMFHQSSGGSHHGHSHGQPKEPANKPPKKKIAKASSAKVMPQELLSESRVASNSNGEAAKASGGTGEAAEGEEEMEGDSASQMNIRGVFLHLVGDALGSVVVIISAVIIWQTNWEYKLYVDPCLSIVLVIIIISSAIPLWMSSTQILLQNVPGHFQIEELQQKLMEEIGEVSDVHDFHLWQLAGAKIIVTAHIRVKNVDEYIEVAPKIKSFFHKLGIHSTTIQPEYTEQEDGTPNPRFGEICLNTPSSQEAVAC